MGINGYAYEITFKDPGIANAAYIRYRSYFQTNGECIGDHVKQNGKRLRVSEDARLMLEEIVAQVQQKQGKVKHKIISIS